MTEAVKNALEMLQRREYRKKRAEGKVRDYKPVLISSFKSARKTMGQEAACRDHLQKQVALFVEMVDNDPPILYEGDIFGFNIGTNQRLAGPTGNVCPNYGRIITEGLDATMARLQNAMAAHSDEDKLLFGRAMETMLGKCLEIAERYRALAEKEGNHRLFAALSHIPRKGARSLYEAMVFQRLCIYALRMSLSGHVTLGRFDQYMYPFYLADRAAGVTDEEQLELIEQYFISLNLDTDIYNGIQLGDNGQSMVLGGFDLDGNDMYNTLSELCMKASLELKLIDPKINLRVGKNTPLERYVFATHMTKAGLGFPQYCNDDVVIPGLIKLGYAPEDAANYVVAACWEYIIPGCGADVPNIGLMNFPLVVSQVITESLMSCDTFEALLQKVQEKIRENCDQFGPRCLDKMRPPQPMESIFIDGCIENLTSLYNGGAKYCNFGIHGVGIAPAADALAAVKQRVYEEKSITKQTLLAALEANFEGYAPLRNMLKDSPKMGNNEDYVDDLAAFLMDSFGQYLNGRDNLQWGIFRAGTGSAMEYHLSSVDTPATADGRGAGEPYPSSFSPSLDVKTNGLLSVIQSFTKYDLSNIINGGPLTLEMHDTVFRNEEGIEKTARLVQAYIKLGGHQLQLNAIDRERLLDAQQHPEKYPNLIVRVWGWSGYFNELSDIYQNHIIRRMEYSV